jgi:uncharacterized protein YuzE
VLRVVHRADGEDIFIVTAHWDRGAKLPTIPEADVLHVEFGPEDARSDGSQEVAPGVFIEFDPEGNPIGVEVISVRRRAEVPIPKRAAAE